MNETYYKLSLLDNENSNLNRQFYPNAIRSRFTHKLALKYYYLKGLPVKKVEETKYELKGINTLLPFTKEQLQSWDKSEVSGLIDSVVRKHELHQCIFDDTITKILGDFSVKNQFLINYIMFPQIFEMIVNDYHIQCGKMHLGIIDSGDSKTDYILNFFWENINYLTIVTDRPEYFSERMEEIYLNNGLVTEVALLSSCDKIYCDVVLNLNDALPEIITRLEQKAVFFDLCSTRTRLQYIACRRKDLRLIYDVLLLFNHCKVEGKTISKFICKMNYKFILFLEGEISIQYFEDFLPFIEEYDLSVIELKKLLF